jgi:myo-inositol-1-phosphate synthase
MSISHSYTERYTLYDDEGAF